MSHRIESLSKIISTGELLTRQFTSTSQTLSRFPVDTSVIRDKELCRSNLLTYAYLCEILATCCLLVENAACLRYSCGYGDSSQSAVGRNNSVTIVRWSFIAVITDRHYSRWTTECYKLSF